MPIQRDSSLWFIFMIISDFLYFKSWVSGGYDDKLLSLEKSPAGNFH